MLERSPDEYDFIGDISRDPGNQKLYEDYKAWLQKEIDANIERARKGEDFHWPTQHDMYAKLEFLKYQDANDVEGMQRSAANLNPNWLALLSRPNILNCGRRNIDDEIMGEKWWETAKDIHRENSYAEWRANHPMFNYEFVCHKKWNEMQATENRKVRFCDECQKNVYFCDNIIEARELGNQGCCVGLDVGIKRKDRDLVGECSIFGRPSPAHLEEEKVRILPDRISAKRIMKETELHMQGKSLPHPADLTFEYGN